MQIYDNRGCRFYGLSLLGNVLSFLENGSHYKPKVHAYGEEESVVAAHHIEALDERGSMVLVGHASVEIVDHHLRQTQQCQMLAFGSLHDAYAPVDIGREAVAQVVRFGLGEVGTCIESLMAHEHAMTERTPREVFGRNEATGMQQPALIVNYIGVAIEHGGQLAVRTVVDVD